jgi:hypothetical protein
MLRGLSTEHHRSECDTVGPIWRSGAGYSRGLAWCWVPSGRLQERSACCAVLCCAATELNRILAGWVMFGVRRTMQMNPTHMVLRTRRVTREGPVEPKGRHRLRACASQVEAAGEATAAGGGALPASPRPVTAATRVRILHPDAPPAVADSAAGQPDETDGGAVGAAAAAADAAVGGGPDGPAAQAAARAAAAGMGICPSDGFDGLGGVAEHAATLRQLVALPLQVCPSACLAICLCVLRQIRWSVNDPLEKNPRTTGFGASSGMSMAGQAVVPLGARLLRVLCLIVSCASCPSLPQIFLVFFWFFFQLRFVPILAARVPAQRPMW